MCFFAALAAAFSMPAMAADQDLWKRAETDHFVIYSTVEAEELVEFARELEKFDGLLRFWFGKSSQNGSDKLDIFLMENDRQVAKLHGWSMVDGFYSRSVEGTFAVAHHRGAGRNKLDGRTVLFHEYAHHFMYNEFSVPVPAWLREGFAEFLSTTEFREDGSWTFGSLASHRAASFRYTKNPKIEHVLGWPDEGNLVVDDFYAWSWALTHMLYTDADRGARISAFIDRLAAGENTLAAARSVFGDLDALENRLHRHVRGEIEFSVSKESFPWSDEVALNTLGAEEGQMVELRLRRRNRGTVEDAHNELEKIVAQPNAPANAYAELAMAEILLEDPDGDQVTGKDGSETNARQWYSAAEVAADKALAIDAGNVVANIAKGRILLHRLVQENRPAGHTDWKDARRYLQIANKAEPDNAEALYRFANSYTQERREGPMMFDAFAAAFVKEPQVPPFRIALAYDLARQGRHDDGIALLQMLANDPHNPEEGKKAIEGIEWMRRTGSKFPPR